MQRLNQDLPLNFKKSAQWSGNYYKIWYNNVNSKAFCVTCKRNNLSQIDSVFYAVEEAATNLNKFNDKTFPVLHLNVRTLNQNFKSIEELLSTIIFKFKVIWWLKKTWYTGDPRNAPLFNLDNYTSVNQFRKHGRGVGTCVFIPNFTILWRLNYDRDLGRNSSDIVSLVIEMINKKSNENLFNKMKNPSKAIYIYIYIIYIYI